MKTAVAVRFADRQTALQVLAQHREQVRDSRPRGIRRDFDFAFFGGLLSATIGVVSLTYSPHLLPRMAIWAGFVASGIIVGHLLDRLRRNYRLAGRLQFSVADFLLLTATIAGLFAFWRFLVHTFAGPG